MPEDLSSAVSLADFRGIVRLFPLPNLVMFPHALQPLHVFEPRYCELVEDALASDKLVAPVMLMPGWEHQASGRPAVASVACVGRILSHERLPDGRFHLILQGLRRAAMRRELAPQRQYREAEVDLLDDFYSSSGAGRRPGLLRRLIEQAQRILPEHDELDEQLARFASCDGLGLLSDVLSHTLPLPLMWKHRLLAEWNVDRRAGLLAQRLAVWPSPVETARRAREAGADFPFSVN